MSERVQHCLASLRLREKFKVALLLGAHYECLDEGRLVFDRNVPRHVEDLAVGITPR